MLIFQAIFPFLLFASGDDHDDDARQSQEPLPPITLEILGGTNVSFSLSYEYLDQVLLPTLEENFAGIRVERELKSRGWSQGRSSHHHGHVLFKIHPLAGNQPLRLLSDPTSPPNITSNKPAVVETIDITVLAPTTMHASLSDALAKDLEDLFPGVPIRFKLLEESGSEARIYILLVALSPLIAIPDDDGGDDDGKLDSVQDPTWQPRSRRHRWGRDILTSTPKKPPPPPLRKSKKGSSSTSSSSPPSLSENISRKVCRDLYGEIFGDRGSEGGRGGGIVDEYLQDQLVIFQALAEGLSSFPSTTTTSSSSSSSSHDDETSLEEKMENLTVHDDDNSNTNKSNESNPNNEKTTNKRLSPSVRLRKDNRKTTQSPFGEGSLHTTTARWVTTELLPAVTWYNDGRICRGVGMRMNT